jgi:hypothetical protein
MFDRAHANKYLEAEARTMRRSELEA